MLCADDEPGGKAVTHSPDVCVLGAGMKKEMKKARPIMANCFY